MTVISWLVGVALSYCISYPIYRYWLLPREYKRAEANFDKYCETKLRETVSAIRSEAIVRHACPTCTCFEQAEARYGGDKMPS